MPKQEKATGGGADRPTRTTQIFLDMHSLGKQVAAETGETMPELWERLAGDRLVAAWEEAQEQLRARHAARRKGVKG